MGIHAVYRELLYELAFGRGAVGYVRVWQLGLSLNAVCQTSMSAAFSFLRAWRVVIYSLINLPMCLLFRDRVVTFGIHVPSTVRRVV